ncbi:spore coat protein U [[Pantoea] beijingensis]|uniref:Spore coat protein U n=2 Tax=[Pantoea] beijingensis TaxID=1324864 RepID=A0A443IE65_9GAMM|nr:spore coat protein U [[Pantoea] beijingensis]
MSNRFPVYYTILTSLLLSLNAAQAGVTTKTFTVAATITAGCAFGNSLTSPIDNLGTINFGSLSSLPNNLDMVSSVGAGSVVVSCTPGATVAIAMDYGSHGGSATRRFMANSSNATQTLAYQLYQDSARSQVWGTGNLAKTVNNFPATTQVWPVYARLFAATPSPTAGSYSDTVTVTLTY